MFRQIRRNRVFLLRILCSEFTRQSIGHECDSVLFHPIDHHEPRKETAKEAPKTAPKEQPGETAGKPAEPPPKKTGSGWIFQVASLTEREKAAAMASHLKSKGFPAFVEEAEVNGRTYYRVRVGPRKERKDIDALAAAVRDKTGQSGQIQRY